MTSSRGADPGGAQGGPNPATRVAVWLLGALTAAALVDLPLSEELTWGFRYPSLMPGSLRLFAWMVLAVALVPRSNRRLRERGAALLDRAGRWGPRTVESALLVAALAAFLFLQSRHLYGDSRATITLLEGGQLINWKEPLDRFVTAVTYRVGRALFGWSAVTAVAMVSTVAGLVWVATSLRLARSVAVGRGDRVVVAGLLLTTGSMQLFFGNVENYSLLAAGILVYLWLGIRFLQGEVRFLAPSLALGITCWIHLAAGWLLPTLPFLFLVRTLDARSRGNPDWRRTSVRWIGEGTLGLGIPTVTTLVMGIALATEGRLTFATFGGGDARMFVPLAGPLGEFEKYTLFGIGHLMAMTNEVILVAGVAACLALAYVAVTPRALRSTSPGLYFVGFATVLLGAFSFLFNADMAVFDVGVRNEWDLLSPPAVPLTTLAGMLLVSWEPNAESRARVGILAIVAASILTGSWVLYNARFFV